MTSGSTLLAEFRDAFPYVTRLPELQAHLLRQGWSVRTAQLPPPLQAFLDLVPLMLRMDTKLHSLATLAKPVADGALWVVLQHFSIRALSQTMVAFYDFAAAAPIDPDLVSAVMGAAPKAVRRAGDTVAEASWERPGAAGAPPALTINLAFGQAGDRMSGARIVASSHRQGPADATPASAL